MARGARGTDYYVELHERVIAGPTPYAQLGIEYEIEGLSVSWAPPQPSSHDRAAAALKRR